MMCDVPKVERDVRWNIFTCAYFTNEILCLISKCEKIIFFVPITSNDCIP